MRVLAVLALLALVATPVFSMTGPVSGTPGNYELIENPTDIEVLAGATATHDETVNNPQNWHKGWYLAGITNKAAGTVWTGMKIEAIGTGVYLVQGTGLTDEWGIVGDSVLCSQSTAVATYSQPGGAVSYDTGGSGTLYKSVSFAFTTDVAYNQKVSFKIFTDNTAYNNDTFGVKFTPITAVPEPSALAGMLGGLVGLVGFGIRRRK